MSTLQDEIRAAVAAAIAPLEERVAELAEQIAALREHLPPMMLRPIEVDDELKARKEEVMQDALTAYIVEVDELIAGLKGETPTMESHGFTPESYNLARAMLIELNEAVARERARR